MAETNATVQAPEKKSWLTKLFGFDASKMKVSTEIIAASIRHPMHVTECALAGADIATVPYKVIEQMTKHPLTDQGIEKFRKDYEAVFGK